MTMYGGSGLLGRTPRDEQRRRLMGLLGPEQSPAARLLASLEAAAPSPAPAKRTHPLVHAGLLSEGDLKGANRAALLQAGLSLLSSSGPSLDPSQGDTWANVGRAGQAGLAAHSESIDTTAQQRLFAREMEIEEAQARRAAMEEAARVARLADPPKDLTDTQRRLWDRLNLDQREKLLESATEEEEGFTLGPDEKRFRGGKVTAENMVPKEADALPTNTRENFAYLGIDPNTSAKDAIALLGGPDAFADAMMQVELERKRAGASSTNVSLGNTVKEAIALSMVKQVQASYDQAAKIVQFAPFMEKALDLVDTPEFKRGAGFAREGRATFGQAMATMGLGDAEVAGIVGEMQALGNMIATQNLTFFPGQISNREFEIALESVMGNKSLDAASIKKTLTAFRDAQNLIIRTHNQRLEMLQGEEYTQLRELGYVPPVGVGRTSSGRRIP